MSAAVEHHDCAGTVFTSDRWNVGGYACTKNAKHEEAGRWWCGVHRPAAVAAREEARRAADTAELAAHRDARATVEALCARLGAGHPAYGVDQQGRPTIPTSVRLSVAEVEALLRELGR